MSDLSKAAETILLQCMGAKPQETLIVVYDPPKEEIATALLETAARHEMEPVSCKMAVRSRDGEEPPLPVAKAMAAADVLLCVTSRSLSHTKARREASAAGARAASLPGVTTEMLTRTMQADYEAIAQRGEAIVQKLTGAREVHITSPAGTDVYVPIKGRKIMNDTGLLQQPGSFGNLPAGEVALAPVKGETYGTLVIDGSMSGAGQLDQPIRIDIERGFATSITGGEAAKRLQAVLEPVGELAYNIAELGIGTNPCAKVTGSVLEDEKVLGTIHMALGNSKAMGGEVEVPVHLDGIVLNPTVTLDDGTILLKDGRLQIE